MQPSEDRDVELLGRLVEAEKTGEAVETTLRTDDRVLARVTDGIYRQPSSALRELIANAYDADAKTVVVRTDAPRFSRITVSDDGAGMSKEALVALINHIGGSSKRTSAGVRLGVAQKGHPSLSPGNRRLIGKIGIGLFSVSQLTHSFRIITKRKGESRRLLAQVTLHTFSEERLEVEDSEIKDVVTGKVIIESVPAQDIDAQGTEIVLLNLQPAARDLLRSRQVWERISDPEPDTEFSGQAFEPPRFHIGRVDPAQDLTIKDSDSLPWRPEDSPVQRFEKLYDAVREAIDTKTGNLQLERILDTYLHTLWTLSLALPLDYLGGTHPFDIDGSFGIRLFSLPVREREPPAEIELNNGRTIRQALSLETPRTTGFTVIVDDVELRRPLKFKDLGDASEERARRQPLMFVGKLDASLASHPVEISGGRELAFEGYFLWSPKVVPRDHAGLMIRIADASGMPFDATFLGYKVAENTRLSQITAEIFIQHGFEAALNIDRESFNFGHPHAKMLTSWVFRALRNLANKHKSITSAELKATRAENRERAVEEIQDLVKKILGQASEEIPPIEFVAKEQLAELRRGGIIAYDRVEIMGLFADQKSVAASLFEEQMKAVAEIMEGLGLLDDSSLAQRQQLLSAIASVFRVKP